MLDQSISISCVLQYIFKDANIRNECWMLWSCAVVVAGRCGLFAIRCSTNCGLAR